MFRKIKAYICMVTICLICYVYFYMNYNLSVTLSNNTLQKKFKFNQKLKFENSENKTVKDFLLNTPGCYIPNYTKSQSINESRDILSAIKKNISCGLRAIFIERIPKAKIKFRVDAVKLAKNKNIAKSKKIKCCYRFVSRSTIPGREDTHLSYSPCTTFKHGTVANLNSEVVIVRCVVDMPKEYIKKVVYEDAYIILKKINIKKPIRKSWNVVVLGMNSISRERAYNSIPQTAQYLQENNWLDFKGYHKVAWNSFPNIMSLLTGHNRGCALEDIQCNEFIWNKFKNAGYITAYGEDHITVPDSLSRNNFKNPPTDHYMHPFFLTGEKRIDNMICMKNTISARNVLNYAYDFIETYKSDPFFGFFWLNSNSHDNVSIIYDSEISDFFGKLQSNQLLNNTFIIFLSAHGNRVGDTKIPISSYYDERSPIFYMWAPEEFKKINSSEYRNLQQNQLRLTTPYDVFATLKDVLKVYNKSLQANLTYSCSRHISLFEEISTQRTCSDACVEDKWCICHNLTDTIQNDSTNRSVDFVVSYIQNRTNTTKTIACMACETLHLNTILRIHLYKSEFNKVYYVVALKMSPGNLLFETTVMDNGKELMFLEERDFYSMSPNNRHGYCVINQIDRQYCFCKTTCL